MKKDYIKLLRLLTEFRCDGIIPEKYLRELDQHIEFLEDEIANSLPADSKKTKTALARIIELIFIIFKEP